MKSIVEQLSTYKSVHLNKDNVKTHFIGIPLIIWAVALLLNMNSYGVTIGEYSVTVGLATIIGVFATVYYFLLCIPLALMVVGIFGPIIYSTQIFVGHEYQAYIAVGTFVLGWVLQFIGHAYEKAKPAFVDDLNQLLIGPLFLIAEVYFALGLDKTMEKNVHELALSKRQDFETSMKTSSPK